VMVDRSCLVGNPIDIAPHTGMPSTTAEPDATTPLPRLPVGALGPLASRNRAQGGPRRGQDPLDLGGEVGAVVEDAEVRVPQVAAQRRRGPLGHGRGR